MNYNEVVKSNYEELASKLYRNPTCQSIEEFYDDLNRIVYVKKLLLKYKEKHTDFHDRLILNHLIALSNVFGVEGSLKLVLWKCDNHLYSMLKSFWRFLNYLPDPIPNGHILFDVSDDQIVANNLKML